MDKVIEKVNKKDEKVEKVEKDNSKKTLHQKLIEIRKEIPYLQKNAKGYNFKYVQGSVLLGLLRPKMDELDVLLSFDIEEITTEETEAMIKGKIIKATRTKLKYVFTFTDADNPSDIISKTIWTQGIGDDIQSMGSYNTYTLRYFLLGFFNIPSDTEDPDAFESSINTAIPVSVEKSSSPEEIKMKRNFEFLKKYGMDKQRTKYHEYIEWLVLNNPGTIFNKILDQASLDEDRFNKGFKEWGLANES